MKLVIYAKRLYTSIGNSPKRGHQMSQLEKLENIFICVEDGKIVEFLNHKPRSADFLLEGDLVVPGFVDCHTHIPFYGYREQDFLRRVSGLSYSQIHNSGGGIYESVSKLRGATFKELVRFNLNLTKIFLRKGVTTIECKTGYGLDEENELKQFRVIEILKKISPIDVIPTFMGAHAIPKGFNQQDYIDYLIKTLDLVKDKCDFVDIFCDTGAFDIYNTQRYLEAAREKGFKLRIHANELSNIGAVKIAVQMNAISADHLLKIDDKDIEFLSQSGTTAVLMPTTSFYLNETYAPARKLIDNGAAIALGSDFNPGSSPVIEPSLVMNLAVRFLGMSPQEILSAYTINSACVLGIADRLGTVEIGKEADFVIYKDADLETIMYFIGIVPKYIVKRGQIFEN
ncbi:imidazolonepropionase [Thermotoga profunda]|uniref:imidazolonepropionase n=1 Tax=Thermotoga profunda TaxID=1508420 RepID=UPI000693E441|nr:imidazolonepropionase [Thermotoga profunda]